MDKNYKVVALDHGNGHVKGKNNTKQFTYVSGYARPEDFARGLEGEFKYNLTEFISNKYDDERYVWGTDVLKGSHLISTFTSEDRYIQKPYKLLTEFALASLSQDEISNIMVFTGVPSREKGTKAEEDLIKAFKGKHIVSVNGRDRIVNVVECKVLNQPLGTVLSMYLAQDGGVKDSSYAEKRVGVIDIGSGTTDIDCLDQLSIVEEDRDTITLGMISAYRKIADYINRENPNARATPQKVEQQINNDTFVISDRANVSIYAIKQKAFRELAEDLINQINQRWTNRAKFDRILLTGGGADLLHDEFQKWEKDIILVENPQMANCNGFFRYGLFYTKQLEKVSASE